MRLVEPDIVVELPWQRSGEVMALPLGLRPIDDADRPLRSGLHKPALQHASPLTPQVEQKARDPGSVAEILDAAPARRKYRFDLQRTAPVARRRYLAPVGAEADERRRRAIVPSAQLAQVQLTPVGAHLRRSGVAQM